MAHTPNALRNARRVLRQLRIEYVDARRRFLAMRGGHILDREDAAGEAVMARHHYWAFRRRVDAMIADGIETGAAWSPNALARVQSSNRRRSA